MADAIDRAELTLALLHTASRDTFGELSRQIVASISLRDENKKKVVELCAAAAAGVDYAVKVLMGGEPEEVSDLLESMGFVAPEDEDQDATDL